MVFWFMWNIFSISQDIGKWKLFFFITRKRNYLFFSFVKPMALKIDIFLFLSPGQFCLCRWKSSSRNFYLFCLAFSNDISTAAGCLVFPTMVLINVFWFYNKNADLENKKQWEYVCILFFWQKEFHMSSFVKC